MNLSLKNKALIFILNSLVLTAVQVHGGKIDDAWILNRQGMHKISQGDTLGAIEDFEKACKLDPFNDTALSNLACARNNLGVTLAKKQDFSEAIRQFKNAKAQKPEDISIRLNLLSTLVTVKSSREVDKEIKELVKLRPNDSDLIIKAATAYQKIENSFAAIDLLQDYIEANPEDSKVSYVLAKLLYLNGNLTDSRLHIAKSLELNPSDQQSLAFLWKLDKEASIEQATNNFSGKHFELVCPDSFSESWAEELLDELENAYEEVGRKLNFFPEQKAMVVLLQTKDFKMVHDLPDWAGGVYDGKIKLPVPNKILPKALRGAILHEYTHHVVYLASSGNCPIWLNEGLAQIFEKGSDNTSLPSIYENEKTMNLYSIDAGFRKNPNRSDAANLYKLSYNATCRFVEEYSWNSIADILQLLALGRSFDEAAKEIIGESQSQIESQIIFGA